MMFRILPPPTRTLGRRLSLSIITVAAFIVVDLVLVAACLLALRQNAWLRTQAAYDEALLTPAKGTAVPSLVGADWTGAPRTIAYGQDALPTLVYTFTQGCVYCQENWHAMRPFQALVPRRLHIIYVDTGQDIFTGQYLTANGIGESVLLVQLSPVVAFVYNARAVPQLLLVDHEGRVQWSHVGELTFNDISKVLSLIEHDSAEGTLNGLSTNQK